MSIYTPCGIWGNGATALTPELYRSWGRTLGHRVEAGAKFVVGGDTRASTPGFLAALVEGLCESGVDVVELGLLPTPMVCYARHRLNAAACAIVTGAHRSAEINGLQWMIGELPPSEDDVQSVRRETEAGSNRRGKRQRSTPRSLDISFDYVAALQEAWVEAMGAQCHAVLDPMHGCCAARARRYLHAIFPQCLFSTIHDTPDGSFAGGTPDCSHAPFVEELCDAVYRERADLGIGFDGDGSRLALIDDNAVALTDAEVTCVLLRSFGPQLRGEPFVYDVAMSDRVPETARQLGAEPLVEGGGHGRLHSRMLQSHALFGAKVGGHYFFRARQGGDDALYTACWLIAHLARSGKTLAELRQECPAVYMTPELRVPVELSQRPQAVERICAAWAEFPQTRIDGVRIETPSGWILVRSSLTESAISFRFESIDWHGLADLVERFCDRLPVQGDELWARYQAVMESSDD